MIDKQIPLNSQDVASATSPAETSQSLRASYYRLTSLGFQPGEAANLIAYRNGIRINGEPWTFSELAGLLFLRQLQRWGHFGIRDGTLRRYERRSRLETSLPGQARAALTEARPGPAAQSHAVRGAFGAAAPWPGTYPAPNW